MMDSSDEVEHQFEAIRRAEMANMLDTDRVLLLAEKYDFDELASFIENNHGYDYIIMASSTIEKLEGEDIAPEIPGKDSE